MRWRLKLRNRRRVRTKTVTVGKKIFLCATRISVRKLAALHGDRNKNSHLYQHGDVKMPRYYYALNDDLPVEETAEDLPDDQAACDLADMIEQEFDRFGGRKPIRIAVYNERRERISRQA
jgi:hypothetical protein